MTGCQGPGTTTFRGAERHTRAHIPHTCTPHTKPADQLANLVKGSHRCLSF